MNMFSQIPPATHDIVVRNPIDATQQAGRAHIDRSFRRLTANAGNYRKHSTKIRESIEIVAPSIGKLQKTQHRTSKKYTNNKSGIRLNVENVARSLPRLQFSQHRDSQQCRKRNICENPARQRVTGHTSCSHRRMKKRGPDPNPLATPGRVR